MIKQVTLKTLAARAGQCLLAQKLGCSVAESCTGGGLAAILTEIPGSSQWFDRGFVTYSNLAKQQMLGVPEATILSKGAVSEETACAMVEGALKASAAQVSIAITGIAGPGGGTLEKPVGTVWIAWASEHFKTEARCYLFAGNRSMVRSQSVQAALEGLIDRLER